MQRLWTILGVNDVRSSFQWYQTLFGQPETEPAHGHFGQILDADGTVLLCLHAWGAHEHPSLLEPRPRDPRQRPPPVLSRRRFRPGPA